MSERLAAWALGPQRFPPRAARRFFAFFLTPSTSCFGRALLQRVPLFASLVKSIDKNSFEFWLGAENMIFWSVLLFLLFFPAHLGAGPNTKSPSVSGC